MRTTLDLPEGLLADAMRATHITTKTKVIITALEEIIRKNSITDILEYEGKVDLKIDMDVMRGRKCKF